MEQIIEVGQVSMTFGDKTVLKDLSFAVERKEIFGFLGPSGAGKTTTIKILTNQLIPNKGTVSVTPSIEEIGILTDNSGVYERLTVLENLKLFADLQKVKHQEIEEILKRVELFEDKDKKAKNLSKGMKQRLILARAVIHKPKLLFLDEPTAALDPATTVEIHALLRELNESGTTIFLTTHNMEEADKLCNRVAFLNKGQIIELGTPEELKLKYAKEEVKIQFKEETIVVPKTITGLEKAIKGKKELISIHSLEPNLEEIFLELTGRELK